MPVPDRDLANRPRVCPNGHQLDPGTFSYSYENCSSESCSGRGHHWIICGTCRARLWLGHQDATWELR